MSRYEGIHSIYFMGSFVTSVSLGFLTGKETYLDMVKNYPTSAVIAGTVVGTAVTCACYGGLERVIELIEKKLD